MRSLTTVFIAAFFAVLAVAQSDGDLFKVNFQTEKKPWTHLEFNNDPHDFQFAIVTDRTGGHRAGVFISAMNKMNLLQPEFVICVGDLIEGYTTDTKTINDQRDEFDGIVRMLEMPFFYVPGNHDLTNDVMRKIWNDRFGRDYYHFVYGDVLFLVINSEDPHPSKIGDEQLAYFRKALDENKDVRWTLCFLHKPMWNYDGNPEGQGWPELETMLADRDYTVFAGHTHNYLKQVRKDRRYLTLATTGGGSNLKGPEYGAFDQIAWVTMKDSGPVIANLMLDGIWGDDIRTPETYALLRPIIDGSWVSYDAILWEGDAFSKGTTMVHLRNNGDLPLLVRGTVAGPGPVSAEPAYFSAVVEPTSTKDIKVSLSAYAGEGVGHAAPVVFDLLAAYEPKGRPPLEIKQSLPVKPVKRIDLPRRAESVVVDGNLSEWADLPQACTRPEQVIDWWRAWTGPRDASFRFAVARDDDYVYIAARVVDDKVVTPNPDGGYDGRCDHLGVSVDARPEPARSAGLGDWEQRFKEYLPVLVNPDAKGKAHVYSPKQLPEGTKVACVKTETGCEAEIAIPASWLDEQQGGPWQALRINVFYNDVEERGGRYPRIYWRPAWDESANYPGSGTFVKR